jgi:hypothetical protein
MDDIKERIVHDTVPFPASVNGGKRMPRPSN